MKDLKPIFFFKEFERSPMLPTFLFLANQEDPGISTKVANYLDACPTTAFIPCGFFDPYVDNRKSLSSSDSSDGVWAWPTLASDIIRKYNIKISPEFLTYLKERSWSPPKEEDIDFEALDYKYRTRSPLA